MKKTAEIEQYKKLVEYLTWLEPEPLEELLQDYEFDVTKNISYAAIDIRPALTIPLAYDWYIDYPRPWADRELGEDLHERNEKVKRLLEGMYTINFYEIEETDQPDAILSQINDREYYYPLEEQIEDYKDYVYYDDEKDLELYYYADVYNLKKVIELLNLGANPRYKLDGEDAIENIKARLSLEEIEDTTVWKAKEPKRTGILLENTIKWSVINRIISICTK